LAKQESRGDLKKDKRVMELAGILNRMLVKDPLAKKERLQFRTYLVTPLNERNGLLEWVSNTQGMRPTIEGQQELERRLGIYPAPLRGKDGREEWKEVGSVLAEGEEAFRTKLLPRYPPTLQRWYRQSTVEPSEWFQKRLNFSRSQAIWCMLGYILGLGDRHGENILIDAVSGDLVHVDFDCTFVRGLHLQKPEVVPFRLTSNCVAALGVTGVEGNFRYAMELFMTVVRANRETLASVVYSFISDPFMDWHSIPKHRICPQKTVDEVVNKMNGHVTYDVWRSTETGRKSKDSVVNKLFPGTVSMYPLADKGKVTGEAGRDRGVALDASRQIEQLIQAAMDSKNLSSMYVGWAPHL